MYSATQLDLKAKPVQSRYVLLWNHINNRSNPKPKNIDEASRYHCETNSLMNDSEVTEDTSVVSLVLGFVQHGLSATDAVQIIEERQTRLQSRKEGLHSFHKMISLISLPSIKELVTKQLPEAFGCLKRESQSDIQKIDILANIKVYNILNILIICFNFISSRDLLF